MTEPLWQTTVVPAPLVPQPYPLWCAEIADEEVSVGRVVAWQPDGDGDLVPVVAFELDNGQAVGANPVRGRDPWFLGESPSTARNKADRAAAMTRTSRPQGDPR